MISIIVPVYNVEDYIVACLNSIIAQTYAGEMECLIVDDCGLDDSMHIVEEFVKAYKGQIRFRILHHGHNLGLSYARNTGMRNAVGEYVYFLDSDDRLTPNCICDMVECLKMHPDAELVQAGCIYTNHNNPFPSLEGNMRLPNYTNDRIEIMELLYKQYELPMISVNKLLSKRFVEDNRLYFIEGVLHEDIPWLFKIGQKLASLAICKHDTYVYVNHNNSISTDMNVGHHIGSWKSVLNFCIDTIDYKFNVGRQIDYIFNHYLNKVQMYLDDDGMAAFEPVLNKLFVASRGKRRVALSLYKLCPYNVRLNPRIQKLLVMCADMNYGEGLH